MTPTQQDHNWNEYRRLVVDHMGRTGEKLDLISGRLTQIEAEISALKVKSGAWGAIAGLVTTAAALLLTRLSDIL